HHHAAAIHRHADVHAEVPAVDLRGRREAGARAAVRILGEAVQLERQLHRAGDAVQSEVAVDDVAGTIGPDAERAIAHGGVLLDFKEICRSYVRVALLVVGVDRAQIDAGFDRRIEHVGAGADLALDLGEATADLADHHVP